MRLRKYYSRSDPTPALPVNGEGEKRRREKANGEGEERNAIFYFGAVF